MRVNLNLARAIVLAVAASMVLPACTTTQLQKQYTSFDACFREQKVIASLAGAVIGGVVGAAIGGSGTKGKVVAAAGTAAGLLLGQKAAWQSCLEAFPPRAQTTLVTPLAAAAVSQTAGSGALPAATTKGLKIQGLEAKPLTFGRDLEVSAEYIYVSDRPEARDVKARVYRNLIFLTPDNQRQEIVSSSEDTIQQGTSRTTFAIPTPSTQDAKELLQTRDWAVRLVVEADGMRSEQVVSLQVPELPQAAQAAAEPAPQNQPVAKPPEDPGRIDLPQGTRLLAAPNSTRVLVRTEKRESARLLQRTDLKNVTWIQVELASGIKGWIKEARQ